MNHVTALLGRVSIASSRCSASRALSTALSQQTERTSVAAFSSRSSDSFFGTEPQAFVTNLQGEKLDLIDLPPHLFTEEIRPDIVHRVVMYQLNKRRQGSRKTKTRSEVSGSTRKPWRQKGSGRARAGDMRQPQMRGGYTVHGPVVRSHATALPKQIRHLGLRIALTSKFQEGNLVIVDSLALEDHKTRKLAQLVAGPLADTWGNRGVLALDGRVRDPNFHLASSQMNVDHLPCAGANVYDVVRRNKLVMTLEAVDYLAHLLDPERRLKARRHVHGPVWPEGWPGHEKPAHL